MKKYVNLRSIMIGISILLCLGGTGALAYLHVTEPTASRKEKKEARCGALNTKNPKTTCQIS